MRCNKVIKRGFELEVCLYDNNVCTIHYEEEYNYSLLYRGYYDSIDVILDLVAHGLEIEANSKST